MGSFIPLEEAQGTLPELIAKMIPGEELFITQNGHVVARLLKAPPPLTKRREAGFAKGSVLYMADDFNAPMEMRECDE